MNGVIGYRAWSASHGLLSAPFLGEIWAREMTARCITSDRDTWGSRPCRQAPTARCRCGIYAYRALDRPELADKPLVGAVLLWGRAYVYEDGIRAEYARVLAFGTVAESARHIHDAVRDAATRMGVHVVPRQYLPLIAAEHGVPIPAYDPAISDAS